MLKSKIKRITEERMEKLTDELDYLSNVMRALDNVDDDKERLIFERDEARKLVVEARAEVNAQRIEISELLDALIKERER